ncbi:MAG TPA: hypothetical protein VHD81_03410 [Mycobacteriales bacterium]|nr:hypothetical protein [Mycobacteriales bacterium]
MDEAQETPQQQPADTPEGAEVPSRLATLRDGGLPVAMLAAGLLAGGGIGYGIGHHGHASQPAGFRMNGFSPTSSVQGPPGSLQGGTQGGTQGAIEGFSGPPGSGGATTSGAS